jgi:signal transduction histidine kinase
MEHLEGRLEGQMRAQERQLVGARLVLVALAGAFLLAAGQDMPGVPVLAGVLAAVTVYSLAVPLLLRRFPAREVGVVVTAFDMAAVTVAVYFAADAVDAYLFYGLVILAAALRFGLGASVWAAMVVSFMYVSVVLASTPLEDGARALMPARIAYLLGFGVVAGLFSRVVIGRAIENARLEQRLDEEERERVRTREQELLSTLGREFVASLDRDETARAIVAGSAPLLGEATLLHLVDEADGRLTPSGAGGPDEELADRLRACAEDHPLRLGEGAAGAAAATATTVVADPSSAGAGDVEGIVQLGLAWLLAVPIISGGRVQGVLVTVGRSPADGPPAELRRRGESIAERAGPALENATLWADLQERMEAERAAQRVKDDFLSIVSHELRTPLTSIQGYAQLLEGRLRAQANPGSKELAHVRVIRSQVGRMRRLVDDLLDVSRIDRRGTVSIERADFDLAELVREAAGRLVREHPERTVTVTVPETLIVHADRDRIDQVLVNLLENALKYSPDRGPVAVALERLGADAQVSVFDQGLGIADEHRDHVFERFYQIDGDAERRRVGGLGLGLYISRAIVDAHGGRVWAEPNRQAGRGTAFAFRIPRRGAVDAVPPIPPTGEPPPFVVRRREGA